MGARDGTANHYFTPGTGTNADYTTPDMGERYKSSAQLYKRLLDFERSIRLTAISL